MGNQGLQMKEYNNNTYNWVDDNIITKCGLCMKEFYISRRKHHCRRCGDIFCYKCSNYKKIIPNYINKVERPYTSYFSSKEKRMCRLCYNDVSEIEQLHEIIDFFNNIPLTLEEYHNMKFVCKTWYKISKYYTNKLKSILFYFPDKEFATNEINILKLNRYMFAGHSKWIIQYIHSQPWEKYSAEETNVLIATIDLPKTCSCGLLFCQGTCSTTLNMGDIMIILSRKIKNHTLVRYLLDKLESLLDSDLQNISEFRCHIFLLINIMISYENYTRIVELIQLFLVRICSEDLDDINHLFWLLTYHINDSNILLKFRNQFISKLDKDKYKLIKNSYHLTQNIIKILNSHTDANYIQKLILFLREFSFVNNKCLLPVNTISCIDKIKYNNLQVLSSKTKPILIPCVINNEEYKVLLKHEDIKKEYIIMNIIKLINMFLLREESLDLKIITYNILPVSKDYGFIEFVPNSKTLYYIKEELKFSIQNWIFEKNNLKDIPEIRDNICRSCAAYCVITYLFGIGDRHLDNIMITEDGKLFHIDFGYILGRDPKLMSPDIRLTPEMIDAMGGVYSKSYINFKIYCSKAFNCIRRHSKLFYIMLCDLCIQSGDKITSQFIQEYINIRFVPGENYEEALRRIQDKIDVHSGENSYAETIIDYFHKKYKTTSSGSNSHSTITNKSGALLHKAKGYGENTKNMMSSFYSYFQK